MMTNPTGRITQGQFSFLPELTDEEVALQVAYGLRKGYAWSVEYTDDPHPRNTFWEMFGNPMFDVHDAAGVMLELRNCRKTFPNHYIRLTAFDSTHRITIEGNVAIGGFVPTSTTRFAQATRTVSVGDGRLTIDAIGGTNTKIDYVDVSGG